MEEWSSRRACICGKRVASSVVLEGNSLAFFLAILWAKWMGSGILWGYWMVSLITFNDVPNVTRWPGETYRGLACSLVITSNPTISLDIIIFPFSTLPIERFSIMPMVGLLSANPR